MKNKFIKVSVNERLPKDAGWFTTFSKLGVKTLSYFNGQIFKDEFRILEIDSFLEEVPDREEEMREVLETIVKMHNHGEFISQNELDKIKHLLTN